MSPNTGFYGTNVGTLVKSHIPIFAIVEVETMPTMLEKWTADAVAKTRAETGQSMVLKALRTKFKNVPKEIEEMVLSMSDEIALESLLENAIHSDTLDEFTSVL